MNIYITTLLSLNPKPKYTNTYLAICARAKIRATNKKDANLICGYTEKHHILPKSFALGGEKDLLNYVYLTGREHFICHKLLTKMFSKGSIFYKQCRWAIQCFAKSKRTPIRILRSKQYEYVKLCAYEANIGKNNPAFGLKRTEASKLAQAIRQHEYVYLINPTTLQERRIHPNNFSKFLAMGYVLSKGTKQQTNEANLKRSITISQTITVFHRKLNLEKRILPTELNDYLQRGYLRGRRSKDWNRIETSKIPNKGRIGIFNLITREKKKIVRNELPYYESIGFVRGFIKNPKRKRINP